MVKNPPASAEDTTGPTRAIYAVNVVPGAAAASPAVGPQWAVSRWFCPPGRLPHLTGTTLLLQHLPSALVAGCPTGIECLYCLAFTSR